MKHGRIIGALLLTLCINIFTPLFSYKAKAQEAEPNIAAQYAVTIDMETGEIIYAKNADEKAYPASTTKLLTALLLAENAAREDILKFTASALSQPAYSFYDSYGPIPLGTTISADDVMKALLLYSGNDIAYVVADYVAGDSESFVAMMNDKLKEWGLENTHFSNPNGLHADDHYTTAYELAIITQKAYENSWVREVMALKKARVTTSMGRPVDLENRNKNLGENGCIGGKTGYTGQAGKCLSAIYERDGRTIIGVVMKSIYDQEDTQVFKDMNSIINYSYAAEKEVYMPAGTELGSIDVSYKIFKFFGPSKTISVPMVLAEDIEIYNNAVNKADINGKLNITEKNAWKLAKNQKAATYDVSERLYSSSYAVKAEVNTSDIIKDNMSIYALSLGAVVLVVALIILISKIASRGSRNHRRSRSRRRRY